MNLSIMSSSYSNSSLRLRIWIDLPVMIVIGILEYSASNYTDG
jgi:hypothetical protein